MTNIAIENGPVEIVDLPNDSMVIFQFVILNYQRVWPTGVNLDIERYIEWVDDCNIPSIYHLPGIPSFNIFQSLPNAYWKILKDIERWYTRYQPQSYWSPFTEPVRSPFLLHNNSVDFGRLNSPRSIAFVDCIATNITRISCLNPHSRGYYGYKWLLGGMTPPLVAHPLGRNYGSGGFSVALTPTNDFPQIQIQ
jgi:hypothetical protein